MISVKLKDISLNITDGKHGDCENESNSGFYFVSCKDIYDDCIHYADARQITESDFIETHRRTKLEPNDILITNSGTIGRMALVKDIPQTYKTTFQKSVAIVKPNQQIVRPAYLYYVLRNSVKQFVNESNGAAQKNLLLGTMREFSLVIEEDFCKQDRICYILQTYDRLIENYQRQIKLLEEMAQRLYKEWFVNYRFPDYENLEFVDGIPAEWKIKKLSEIADVIMGQSPKSEFYNCEKKGLPFHQGVGTYGTRYVQDETYTTSYTKIADANSILFSVRAPVGRLNISKNKIVIGRGIAAINSKDGNQSFLYYMLKEKFFKDDILGNGAIFASISKNELLNLSFLMPNSNIILEFESIVEVIDRKLDVIDIQLKKLIEARDRLLPKIINGEVEL